jgi:heme/copper-type cytochrome/quinol oxidase subunit 1
MLLLSLLIPFISLDVLLIISLPVLAGVITMIISDRHSNRPSPDPLRGGDLLLSQHLP